MCDLKTNLLTRVINPFPVPKVFLYVTWKEKIKILAKNPFFRKFYLKIHFFKTEILVRNRDFEMKSFLVSGKQEKENSFQSIDFTLSCEINLE